MAPNRRVKCEAGSNDFSDPALIMGFRTISRRFLLSRVLARRRFGDLRLARFCIPTDGVKATFSVVVPLPHEPRHQS